MDNSLIKTGDSHHHQGNGNLDPVGVPYQHAYQEEEPGESKSPKSKGLVDVIYRGKWIIIAMLILSLSGAYYRADRLVPTYEAYSQVLFDLRLPDDVKGVLDSENPVFTLGNLANEILILQKSRDIMEQVASDLLIIHEQQQELPIFGSGTPSKEVLVQRLREQIDIRPDRQGYNVVRVTAKSTNPTEAILLANLFADEVPQHTRETSLRRLDASRAFLEMQVQQHKQRLLSLDNQIQRHQAETGTMGSEAEIQSTVNRESALRSQQQDIEIRLALLNRRQQELIGRKQQLETGVVTVIASTSLEQMERNKQEIAQYQTQLDQLRRSTNPDTNSIEFYEAAIGRLRAENQELAQRYSNEIREGGGGTDQSLSGQGGFDQIASIQQQLTQVEGEIRDLELQDQLISQNLSEARGRLSDLPEQLSYLTQLNRDRATTRQTFEMLQTRLENLQVAEQIEGGYASVIHEADNAVPGGPSKGRTLVMGGVLGLLLGFALAWLKVKATQSIIYRPEDLQERGYRIVGVIPNMKKVIRKKFKGKTVQSDGRTLSTALISLHDPMSVIVDSYRRIRAQIQYSRTGAEIRTILVTSPKPGDGKSLTATNLAIVMAQSGRRTVIVDTDLRRPTLHEKLGLRVDSGLVEIILDGPQHFEDEYRVPGIENLFAIAAGRAVDNPAELLGSSKMTKFLDELKEEFDIVILDTPPVNFATDALELSPKCDASIIVVSAGQTKEHELSQCHQALRSTGSFVLGTLLNRFEPKMADSYRYKYGYLSNYSQKYGDRTPVRITN